MEPAHRDPRKRWDEIDASTRRWDGVGRGRRDRLTAPAVLAVGAGRVAPIRGAGDDPVIDRRELAEAAAAVMSNAADGGGGRIDNGGVGRQHAVLVIGILRLVVETGCAAPERLRNGPRVVGLPDSNVGGAKAVASGPGEPNRRDVTDVERVQLKEVAVGTDRQRLVNRKVGRSRALVNLLGRRGPDLPAVTCFRNARERKTNGWNSNNARQIPEQLPASARVRSVPCLPKNNDKTAPKWDVPDPAGQSRRAWR